MRKLLNKEMKLSASVLSYLFIAFSLMTLLPGYPILLGAFFVSFGIFQSYSRCRENGDIIYSALLPVNKSDVVKSKFLFAFFIQMIAFAIMTVLTVIRMAFMYNLKVYVSNALMPANFVFLGFALVIFGCFNFVFIRGFFKTAYYFGKPFVLFIIVSMLVVCAGETLWHVPGFETFGTLGFENMILQIAVLFAGMLIYVLLTLFAVKNSVKRFEKVDL